MPSTPIPRVLLRSLLLVLLVYAAFAGLVWLFAERLIFLPPHQRYAQTPEIRLIPRPAVIRDEFFTAEATLPSWCC
jgi:hypothetical protein